MPESVAGVAFTPPYLGPPRYANHSNPIVSDSGNGSGHVRTMAHAVYGIVALGWSLIGRADEIPAANVVNIAVVIVVDAVVGKLFGVGPNVGGDVRMVVV